MNVPSSASWVVSVYPAMLDVKVVCRWPLLPFQPASSAPGAIARALYLIPWLAHQPERAGRSGHQVRQESRNQKASDLSLVAAQPRHAPGQEQGQSPARSGNAGAPFACDHGALPAPDHHRSERSAPQVPSTRDLGQKRAVKKPLYRARPSGIAPTRRTCHTDAPKWFRCSSLLPKRDGFPS